MTSGETLLSGATVTLRDSGGGLLATQQTGVDGADPFVRGPTPRGLPTHLKTVSGPILAGLVGTTAPTSVQTAVVGQVEPHSDSRFGYRPPPVAVNDW